MEKQDKILLQQALAGKNMVVVYRDDIGGTYYGGIPVVISAELGVLHKEREFALDGYVAFRLRDVTAVEQYDDNDFARRVLAGEGVYAQAAAPNIGGAGDWRQLLEGIMAGYGGWLSVECETPEDTLFYVGVARGVDSTTLTLRRVDADGSWHPQEAQVPLEDITCITFGGNYLGVYARYCT